ncbi:hypothetical protein L204_102888 [Cryptococcus depauperatus]
MLSDAYKMIEVRIKTGHATLTNTQTPCCSCQSVILYHPWSAQEVERHSLCYGNVVPATTGIQLTHVSGWCIHLAAVSSITGTSTFLPI